MRFVTMCHKVQIVQERLKNQLRETIYAKVLLFTFA